MKSGGGDDGTDDGGSKFDPSMLLGLVAGLTKGNYQIRNLIHDFQYTENLILSLIVHRNHKKQRIDKILDQTCYFGFAIDSVN